MTYSHLTNRVTEEQVVDHADAVREFYRREDERKRKEARRKTILLWVLFGLLALALACAGGWMAGG